MSPCLSLQESMSQLSMENSRLKSANSGSSSVATGNDLSGVTGTGSGVTSSSVGSACSTELDYLHQAVDSLKATVLEQRNFLIGISKS